MIEHHFNQDKNYLEVKIEAPMYLSEIIELTKYRLGMFSTPGEASYWLLN